MTEREDKVYKAKLAEQAERYDGKKIKIIMQGDDPVYSPKIQDVRAVASY